MSKQALDGLLDDKESQVRIELSAEAGSAQLSAAARRRLTIAVLTLLALLALPYVVPSLSHLRPISRGDGYVPFWNIVGREWLGQEAEFAAQQSGVEELEKLAVDRHPKPETSKPAPVPEGEALAATPEESGSAMYPAYAGHPDEEAPAKTEILGEDALNHYFSQLTLAEMRVPGVIARAGHWGDSVIGDDGVTHAIRKRMQARFGDGGHGFHLLSRYNLAYRHLGIQFRDRGWRSCQIIFKCQSDGHYGYGGVSTESSAGGTSVFSTTKEGLGSRVSRFELWYAKHPSGGKFQIKVDGEVRKTVDTKAELLSDGVASIQVPDGPHQFEVRAIGGGLSRAYGVTLERDGPGVVWDGLALIGAFTQRLDYQDEEHIMSQMQHRKIDLMVFMLGGNDVQRQKMDLYRSMQPYEDEYARVIRKFRKGRPQSSCLVMSLVDHGERVGRYGIRTRKIVPSLVESQRKVALNEGCAFFNTFEAMGGQDSVGRWYHANPRLMGADFGHPTSAGHQVIASLFYQSLMHSYGAFRRTQAGKPFPQLQDILEAPGASPTAPAVAE